MLDGRARSDFQLDSDLFAVVYQIQDILTVIILKECIAYYWLNPVSEDGIIGP